jgi:hypothetical protein
MIEIKAALDAAFAAYFDALANGVPEQTALDVGIARYRAFFPNATTSPFEAAIEAAREKARSASAARGNPTRQQTGWPGGGVARDKDRELKSQGRPRNRNSRTRVSTGQSRFEIGPLCSLGRTNLKLMATLEPLCPHAFNARGGKMRRPNKHHERALADVSKNCAPNEERDWVQRYGQHLGHLYEPSAELPPELDHLVNAIARRLAD